MIRISDMIKCTPKKFLIEDDALSRLLEILYNQQGYYKKIQNSINKGLEENKNEVMVCLSIRSIKKQMKMYLKKDETFTEDQLVKVIENWAMKQDETMESKFKWKFEEDAYGDLYFTMKIGLR